MSPPSDPPPPRLPRPTSSAPSPIASPHRLRSRSPVTAVQPPVLRPHPSPSPAPSSTAAAVAAPPLPSTSLASASTATATATIAAAAAPPPRTAPPPATTTAASVRTPEAAPRAASASSRPAPPPVASDVVVNPVSAPRAPTAGLRAGAAAASAAAPVTSDGAASAPNRPAPMSLPVTPQRRAAPPRLVRSADPPAFHTPKPPVAAAAAISVPVTAPPTTAAAPAAATNATTNASTASGTAPAASSSPRASGNPPRRARSSLDCPICLSLMVDPTVSRCGHSFCRACIQAYLGYQLHKRRRNSPPVQKPCPVCKALLCDPVVYPNAALAALVEPARREREGRAPSVVDVDLLGDDDADALLSRLVARKARRRGTNDALRCALSLPFLERCRAEAHSSLERINDELRLVTSDIERVTSDQTDLSEALVTDVETKRKQRLVSRYHDNVKAVYLQQRRARADRALDGVVDMLVDATSVSTVVRRASIQHIDIMSGNHNLISSIEFNSAASMFATAGATKRIKLFEFSSLFDGTASAGEAATQAHHHYPILEISTSAKLSCLSWSRERAALLAASTYKGDILVHDTEANSLAVSLREHTKRAWFVDFSSLRPSLLLSSSDDNTVKLWDVRAPASTMTLQTAAIVCCGKFNPVEENEFAFGSADHNVYSYDLRYPETPLCVFEGHWRAVSHVLFLNRGELISASTDSSCKLWNVEKQEPGLSYAGHTNDNYFVGLCGSRDFFACGSEDNSVCVYHKGFAGPVVRYAFGSGDGFVSSVAWKPDSRWLIAANNAGCVEVLELQ